MLKGLLKLVASLFVLTALAVGGLYAYYFIILPRNIPPPEMQVDITPARVARGEYLATAVFGCMYCHSERDWSLFGAPPVPGTLGKGGERFDESVGVSGVLIAANITPAGIGDWTEADLIARFKAYAGARIPVGDVGYQTQHAWSEYAKLSEADLAAIYAYLMVQPPVRNAVGPTG